MNIEVPPATAEKLMKHATAAGFDSVESYLAEFVRNLADHPNAAERFAPLTADELTASLAMIDQGSSEIAAGKGMNVTEAHDRTVEKFGSANP